MIERIIETKVSICDFDELNADQKMLIEKAKSQANNAYAPYSGFRVGAAVLLANGEVFGGNNQENAAYPSVDMSLPKLSFNGSSAESFALL